MFLYKIFSDPDEAGWQIDVAVSADLAPHPSVLE